MRYAAGLLVLALLVAACAGGGEEAPEAAGREEVRLALNDPPAGEGAMAPRLVGDGTGALLSWVEPVDGEDGHRLRVARFDGMAWGEAITVHEGVGMFVNWADTPSVVVEPEGALLAHWLEKVGEGAYAYGARLARSTDDGASWRDLGWLHDDRSPTEHGFVTLVPGHGGALAVWLDGRAMADGGAMSLRAGAVDRAPVAGDVLDERVCECCDTAAVATREWVIVAYRDRADDEVRDVWAVRGDAYGWGEPYPLSHDGWEIPGCPVNGPALAVAGRRVAAAWFTAAGGEPRVRAALSEDGGRSFGAAVEVAGEDAVGRVDVEVEPEGTALVSWLGAVDGGGEADAGDEGSRGAVWLRRVAADGRAGAPIALAETSTVRASGFPRLLLRGGEVWLAWVETGDPGRLRFGRLPRSAVPAIPPGTPDAAAPAS